MSIEANARLLRQRIRLFGMDCMAAVNRCQRFFCLRIYHLTTWAKCAPAIRLSNEKSKGDGNRKNGNAYLSWAMTELANLMVRHNPSIKKKYDRQLKKSRLHAKAIRSIAAQLARCIWHMLMKDEDFQIDLAFK